jgi:hypothetical protein
MAGVEAPNSAMQSAPAALPGTGLSALDSRFRNLSQALKPARTPLIYHIGGICLGCLVNRYRKEAPGRMVDSGLGGAL